MLGGCLEIAVSSQEIIIEAPFSDSEQEINSCEDRVKLLQSSTEQRIEEMQKSNDQEIPEEMHEEFHGQSYSMKSEFPGGNNQLSKLEFRVLDEFDFSKDMSFDVAPNGMGELVDMSFDPIDFGMNSFRTILVSFLANSSAHDMFDEMSLRDVSISDSRIQPNDAHLLRGNWGFDPGDFIVPRLANGYRMCRDYSGKMHTSRFVFDPGILKLDYCDLILSNDGLISSGVDIAMEANVVKQRFQWDPGGLEDQVVAISQLMFVKRKLIC